MGLWPRLSWAAVVTFALAGACWAVLRAAGTNPAIAVTAAAGMATVAVTLGAVWASRARNIDGSDPAMRTDGTFIGAIPAHSASGGAVPAARRQPRGPLIGEMPGPFAFGVHRAITTDAGGLAELAGAGTLPELPEYVARAHDDRLRKAIDTISRTSLMVVLVGDSSTGKTRALWEAIRRLPAPQWRVWSPASPQLLNDGVTGFLGPRTVICLNDAHNFLDPMLTDLASENAALLSQLISDPSSGPVLIAGTFWLETWQRLTAQPRDQAHFKESDTFSERSSSVPTLLEAAISIRVPDSFEENDLQAMSVAARRDPRIGIALRHAAHGKITQYLAGAQHLLERYSTAPPETRALMDAAIDARRCGHANHLPERMLLEAASGYIGQDSLAQLGVGWETEALHAATLNWRGLDGPLTPIPPAEPSSDGLDYRLADVLEQTGALARRYICPPEQFWVAAARYGHFDHLRPLAAAAQRRGRYRNAAMLYMKAAGHSNTDALVDLAQLREQAGDHAAAMQLVFRSAGTDQGRGLAILAKMREKAENHAGADDLALRAADAGETRILRELAGHRADRGDYLGAERLAQMAAEAGHIRMLVEVGWMHTSLRENYEAADRLFRQGADAGDARGLIGLAEMRSRAGEHQAAEQLLHQAAESGDPTGLIFVGTMKERTGDDEGATRLYRKAAAADQGESLANHAAARTETENNVDAERLARIAAEAGSTRALVWLASVHTSNRDEAERMYRRAAHAGDTRAMAALSLWREAAGDHMEADRLAMNAFRAGDRSAVINLAENREKTGNHVGAEQLVRWAAKAGDIEAPLELVETREQFAMALGPVGKHDMALRLLASMLELDSNRTSAEEFARLAEELALRSAEIDKGRALIHLTKMREKAGDRAGAERLAHKAVNLDHGRSLAALARTRDSAGDNASAKQLYRKAAEAGDPQTLVQLARARDETGDHTGAAQLYRKAADVGDAAALAELAQRREAVADHVRAEHLAQKAFDVGLPWAISNLARTRAEAGDDVGAARLFRQGADAGDLDAVTGLVWLKERAGEHLAANQLHLYGLDPSGSIAEPWSIENASP